ncbi:hypothetical protein [Microcoleus sp. herbarium12]|uniref:hypothetical protein n=1 Tax=Microcoleus sp. herbarium12 TaxID=3055437 RepID=UPI002FD0BAB0
MRLIIGDKIRTVRDRTPTQETGFFSEFATATRTFGHSPNCVVKKPGFWQNYGLQQ